MTHTESPESNMASVSTAAQQQTALNEPPSYTRHSVAATSTTSLPDYTQSNPGHEPPTYMQSAHPSTSKPNKKRVDPALRWGVTPSGPGPATTQLQAPPPDHPVHRMTAERQAELLAKGINPVLKAEMDAATGAKDGNGKGGFWRRVMIGAMSTSGAGSGMGGGC